MSNKTVNEEVQVIESVTCVSVIIPCYNEENGITHVIHDVDKTLSKTSLDYEILVVDDGSTDESRARALEAGARVVIHNKNMGYGYAIMNGVTSAQYPLIAIIDADGSYPAEPLISLIENAQMHEMVIGARIWGRKNTSHTGQLFRKLLYYVTYYLTSKQAIDYNSGIRVFRKDVIEKHRDLMCPTFSFTTTVTLLHLLTNRSIHFIEVQYDTRIGKSKVSYIRDSLKTISYVFKLANIFQPYRLSLAMIILLVVTNGIEWAVGRFLGLSIPFMLAAQLTTFGAFIIGMFAIVTTGASQQYIQNMHISKRSDG